LSIAFVLIAERVNPATEGAIDTATTSFDPHAKLAKDIAAGSVLIASVNAVAVGYIVFARRLSDPSSRLIDRVRNAPIDLTLIALVVTILIVIGTKALTGRGTPLRGGLPSGHAALAFAGWIAVTYVLGDTRHRFLVSSLTFVMALLVAKTRVESGVHSLLEVAYGGLIGAIVTLVLFQAFAGPIARSSSVPARRRSGPTRPIRSFRAAPRPPLCPGVPARAIRCATRPSLS